MIFDIRPPQPSYRIHFICSKVNLEWRSLIPDGYRLVQVNSSFNPDEYEIPDDITEWMSNSLEEQKGRGFGKCLVHGKRIVVWINADCASGTDCEIGITTTKDYRKRGLGAATAAATVEDCLSSGFSMVGWHADTINHGSIATAKKIGFVKERDYVHYICMFDEATHYAETALRLFFDGKYEKSIVEFNNAFRLGEVAVWFYPLAARAHGALGESEKTKELLIHAKSKGWSNWDSIRKCDELKDLMTPNDWDLIMAS
jgi:RimJ/RimL family protein N-acetyltransferase